ncbi:putative aldehyde dehydrogenase [Ktedonobacteria bacterium brp13]|nr:putative aldehyde dehydrogenase [Ktedonobacteria bacterium brp13]
METQKETYTGSPYFPTVTGTEDASSHETIEQALITLQAQKDAWAGLPVTERITLLDTLLADFSAIAPRWTATSTQAKGLTQDSPYAVEEWAAGAWPLIVMLRQLRTTLEQIQRTGKPQIPGAVTTRPDGQVIAQVFPRRNYDRLFFGGVNAEIWMQPGVTKENLADNLAVHYQKADPQGKVSLILGAGNVASIGPMDILTKLFIDNEVVIFKANPINAYLGPLLAEAFRALITPGYLRLVYGGAEEGAYLCKHAKIDTIHITGSDKTFESIVFGSGKAGAERKASHQPLLQKPVSGELGNVSPVIIVPGPWSASDIAYQAEHIATSISNNAGFNCNASRIIIQQADWSLRLPLLQQLRRVLASQPARKAYYPGAQQRYQTFIDAHPDAEQFGKQNEDELPWTLISGLDAEQHDDICFTTEAFCNLCAETTLPAKNTVEYIERAVDFANNHLWGTLNITLIVHPKSLQDPAIAAAIERSIANLHYGSIGINYWAGISFALGLTTWGAYPGHDIYDIQSGNGVVHNTLMFARPQKSVLRGPFRSFPKPPWFGTQAAVARKLFPRLVAFEAKPTPWKVPAIILNALA